MAWGTLGNDIAGNCVVASFGHLISAWTALTGSRVSVSEEAALEEYAELTGYNRLTGQPDPGLVVRRALEHWTRHGLQGHKVHKAKAYAYVGRDTRDAVRAGIHHFGGVALAMNLPKSADDEFRNGDAWRKTLQPGKFGHCVAALAYDDKWCDVVTWGCVQRVSWKFVEAYGREVWAVVSTDYIGRNHKSPGGKSLSELASMAAIWASPWVAAGVVYR